MENQNVMAIDTDYVTLGQLLKHFHLIHTGGEEKLFVTTHDIAVDGVKENRRGRKLRDGNSIVIDGVTYSVCSSKK
ncbi:MAG: RNA-binding S4 domain-containing protein [Bacilli bacterium]|jgi:ribosome-associated protein|nr:RNA-binding S4 domain-containing protein [Bacilli bacterium]